MLDPLNIRPTASRIEEIVHVLKDPKNKVDLRLKSAGIIEQVAHAIGRAEMYIDVFNKFREEKEDAKKRVTTQRKI